MDSPTDDLDLPPINIWNRDGTLHSRRPYKGLERANTLPTRKTAFRATERTVRFSLDNQRTPSPDPFVIDFHALDMIESRTRAQAVNGSDSGSSTPTLLERRRTVHAKTYTLNSPKGDKTFTRYSYISPTPYRNTSAGEGSSNAAITADQETTVKKKSTNQFTTHRNAYVDKGTQTEDMSAQQEDGTCTANSLERSNSTVTIRPLRKKGSIASMDSAKSDSTIKATSLPNRVGHNSPESFAISDKLSTRANPGSHPTWEFPDDDDYITPGFEEANRPAADIDFATTEEEELIRQGRAAIGSSKYPFTIDKATGKHYFSPSQINREIRAVQAERQHAALQFLIESKKRAEAAAINRPASAYARPFSTALFEVDDSDSDTPIDHEAAPNDESRFSVESEARPKLNRTSTLRKRLSGISFRSVAAMSPSSRAQASGPVALSTSTPTTPTVAPFTPSTSTKPRMFTIIPSFIKKSKGKGRESTSPVGSSGNASAGNLLAGNLPAGNTPAAGPTLGGNTLGGTTQGGNVNTPVANVPAANTAGNAAGGSGSSGNANAGPESIAKFQLTPLSGLIKQSYIDIDTLRTLKGNIIDSPAADPNAPGGTAPAIDPNDLGSLLVGVDFDRIEANLKRFEDLYEAFLAYGDGTSGGPAEEVHLVAMICKRSDVTKGGMKSDNSVPRVDN